MSPPSWTSHDFGDGLSKPSIYKGRVDSEILLPTRTARPQSKTKIRGVTLHVRKSILTEKYGEESEIVKAYTREILDIPSVPNANSKKISEFSESTSLAFKIQFHLETEKIGVILRSKPGHQTFSALYSTVTVVPLPAVRRRVALMQILNLRDHQLPVLQWRPQAVNFLDQNLNNHKDFLKWQIHILLLPSRFYFVVQ